MTATAQDTQNVLDMMTAGVMQRKSKAAAKLTPVGGEVRVAHVVPTNIPAAFPNDVPGMELELALVEVERQLKRMQEAIDAIRGTLGTPSASDSALPVPDQKAAEREADARVAAAGGSFAEQFAAQQEAAKSAVFTAPTVVADEAEPEAAGGWTCPTHGKAKVTTSRLNRQYHICPECDEFERLP